MFRDELVFVLFGFFKAFKPSEPFLTPYLVFDKGLTEMQVRDEVYPIWTYSYFALILPITFLAESFGYTHVIMLEVIGHLSTRYILIFGQGLRWMQSMQVTFGLACAGELVYYAYVFKVFPTRSQKMTSFSRSAVLMGHCLGSLLGQLLLLSDKVKLVHLFWISATSVTIASIVSLWFPRSKQVEDEQETDPLLRPSYEEKSPDDKSLENVNVTAETEDFPAVSTWKTVLVVLVPFVIYALNMVHLYNIEGYSSVLWQKTVSHDRSKMLHGYADVGCRGLGALFAISAWRYLHHPRIVGNIKTHRYALLSLALIFITAFTLLQAVIDNIYLQFVLYIFCAGFGGMVSAVASAWMGQSLPKAGWFSKRYAVIFGLATLLCSGIQTVMLLVITNAGISVTTQFFIYTVFIGVVAIFTISQGLAYAFSKA